MTQSNYLKQVLDTVESCVRTHEEVLRNPVLLEMIAAVSELTTMVVERGDKVLLFGNGGSAADAQHIAAEFVGRFAIDRQPMPALALSVNTSCITAIGNDYGFDQLFSRQIGALGRAGDLAIGISTSGDSQNVCNGLVAAKQMGLHTVAMTGCTGGRLKNLVDHCLCVPSMSTPRIQECHILFGHIISELTERAVFHGQSGLS